MSEFETKVFLRERAVAPLDRAWQPHQPVLYVLEEPTRHFWFGKHLPPEKYPSIARLDDPAEMDLDTQLTTPDQPERIVYYLGNDGGIVNYYAIDPQTKEPLLVHSSNPIKNRTTDGYYVKKENLFVADDALFPRAELSRADLPRPEAPKEK